MSYSKIKVIYISMVRWEIIPNWLKYPQNHNQCHPSDIETLMLISLFWDS